MMLYSRKRGLVSSFDSVNRVYYQDEDGGKTLLMKTMVEMEGNCQKKHESLEDQGEWATDRSKEKLLGKTCYPT